MMTRWYKYRNKNGFSLVELAVVLAIVGVIISGGITVAVGQREMQRIRKTNDRMETIMQSILDYADYYDHLPCPADPTASFSDNDFGTATATGGDPFDTSETDCDTTTGVIDVPDAPAEEIYIGVVPVSTLNLPPDFVLDGWNNRITYVVDRNFIYRGEGDNGYNGDVDPDAMSGSIIVNNAAGVQITSEAAVLIISHGPNGFRAWGGRGGRNGAATNAGEIENGDDDDTFVQSILNSGFDDTVIFWEIWQLRSDVE